MKTILIIGTYDTKLDELLYLTEVILKQGGAVLTIDVSVIGNANVTVDINKHEVIQAIGETIEGIIAYSDENRTFQAMSSGASTLALKLYLDGKIDGMISLGGTMGTDLALDVAMALPIGVPKYIVSTVAFSPLISIERIAPDVQMILWAGGLYGLNPLCKSTLSQAGGAVLGAAKAVQAPDLDKPIVGITSLGKTALQYMVRLVPELEKRGYAVAVFHSTGSGGRTYETLCAQQYFACTMDFCLQEFINGLNGSAVASGSDRLTNASAQGIPQMVAPGATNIIDFLATYGPPAHLAGRQHHAHNRLIDSVLATPQERVSVANAMFDRLSKAAGAIKLFLPLRGIIEWDKEGMPTYDPEGLEAFNKAVLNWPEGVLPVEVLDCHINDDAFIDAVLATFDDWVDQGII